MSIVLIQIYTSSLVILFLQNLIRFFLYLFLFSNSCQLGPFSCHFDFQLFRILQEALKTILIVFAKLNSGIRYFQGMNEVLAPLFYVFKNDPDEENEVSTSLQTLSHPSFSFSFKMLTEGHMLIQWFHLHKRKWKKQNVKHGYADKVFVSKKLLR